MNNLTSPKMFSLEIQEPCHQSMTNFVVFWLKMDQNRILGTSILRLLVALVIGISVKTGSRSSAQLVRRPTDSGCCTENQKTLFSVFVVYCFPHQKTVNFLIKQRDSANGKNSIQEFLSIKIVLNTLSAT